MNNLLEDGSVDTFWNESVTNALANVPYQQPNKELNELLIQLRCAREVMKSSIAEVKRLDEILETKFPDFNKVV